MKSNYVNLKKNNSLEAMRLNNNKNKNNTVSVIELDFVSVKNSTFIVGVPLKITTR